MYPKGLKLDFTQGKIVLDTNDTVSSNDATKQVVLVNLGTHAGTDNIFPERGTNLLKNATSGVVIGSQEMQHAANFAALDSLFFIRGNEPKAVSGVDYLTQITLKVDLESYEKVNLDLELDFESGLKIGEIVNI